MQPDFEGLVAIGQAGQLLIGWTGSRGRRAPATAADGPTTLRPPWLLYAGFAARGVA